MYVSFVSRAGTHSCKRPLDPPSQVRRLREGQPIRQRASGVLGAREEDDNHKSDKTTDGSTYLDWSPLNRCVTGTRCPYCPYELWMMPVQYRYKVVCGALALRDKEDFLAAGRANFKIDTVNRGLVDASQHIYPSIHHQLQGGARGQPSTMECSLRGFLRRPILIKSTSQYGAGASGALVCG